MRKVTKLETGLPGRPMKKAVPTLPAFAISPKASGRPGFMAMRHMSSWPSASTAGLTKSASPTSPKASGRPGFMAMRHISIRPSASTAGLT
jgi:hypothetical protein